MPSRPPLAWPVALLIFLLAPTTGALADPQPGASSPSELRAPVQNLEGVRRGVDGPWSAAFTNGLDGAFGVDGLRFSGEGDEPWDLGLQLVAYGRSGALNPAQPGALRTSEHRADLDHGGLREWVARAGSGLQHGFTVARPSYVDAGGVAEAGSGDLLLDLQRTGTFEASLSADGSGIELRHGHRVLFYGAARATDARQRELPARVELKIDGNLRLRVDTAGAAYPVRVASNLTEIKKLVNTSAQAIEDAGWSVAISGDTAVVGARFADVPLLADAGKVYVFERDFGGPDNWGLVKEIRASDPQTGAHFGVSVAIDGDYIAVGANNHDDFLIPGSGRAYVFARNEGGLDNWGEIRNIANPTPQINDWFGWSVALNGDTLVVTAMLADQPFIFDAGEAVVYQKDQGGFDSWGEVKTLLAPTPAAFDLFGQDAAIDGDTVVIGAMLRDVENLDDGAAFVFERNSGGPSFWGLTNTLQANDGKTSDRFGDAVAVDGDTIVVGADFADNTGIDTGSAYVFERDNGGVGFWGQSAKLTASDLESGDYFGWAVAVEGDDVIVGAHLDDSPLLNAGSAYLFRRDAGGPGAWGEVEKFTSATLSPGDDFGIAVDLDNGTLVVGARLDGDVAPLAGAAYIFELTAVTDLAISASASPDPVAPGGSVVYTVTGENLGSSDAADVAVTHGFAPDAGVGSSTSGCGEDPLGIANCTLGTVAAGATVQYTLTRPVDAGASGVLGLTATLASAAVDPSPANNEVTVTTLVGGGGGGSADLLLLKIDSVDPVAPGASLTYTLEVINNGPDTATNVVVTDTLPAGLTGAVTSGCAGDPSGLPACALGDLPAGGSKSFTITASVAAAAGTALLNTATVTADTGDPAPTDNTATEATQVGAGSADLTIVMDDSADPIQAGDALTYTVQVINNGPDAAPDVQVATVLPPGVTSPVTAGCAEDPAGTPNCGLGEIAAGAIRQFSISVMTDPGSVDTLVATAEVTSAADDPAPADNSTTEATLVEATGDVDLFLIQTDSQDPIDAGETLVYTIYVGNRGPSVAQGVVLTDILPTLVDNPVTVGCQEDGGGVPTCTLGTVGVNEIASVTVTVGLSPAAFGTLSNQVSVTSANPELDPTDNQATETTTVVGAPGSADLLISIEEAADPVKAGDPLTYRVEVLNIGPQQALDVSVASVLPPGLGPAITAGCQQDPSGTPTCLLGTLDVGLPKTFTITADVDLTTSGTLVFEASVDSSTEDPNPANNSDTESTEIEAIALADLNVTFTQAAATAAPGGGALYEVTVENLGPADASGVVVSGSAAVAEGGGTTSGCAEDPSGFASCTLGSIAVGASASYTVELTVPADATHLFEVTVGSAATEVDPETANDTATFQTEIDDQPPAVFEIDSVGDTGDGEVTHCEEVRIGVSQLLVSFTETMFDPAGDADPADVTRPANYQLVAAGADRDLATTECGAAAGDDELTPITAVSYDPDLSTATLDFGKTLPDGPYRLLVCDTVADAAGNRLDGDGDGQPGGAFPRYFRIETTNLFSGGHFDCGLEAWSETAATDTEIKFSFIDLDSAQISGSGLFFKEVSTALSVGQCAATSGRGSYTMTGSLRLEDVGADVTMRRVCEYFDGTDCGGVSLATESAVETFTAPNSSWAAMPPWSSPAPAGTLSALCSLEFGVADPGADMAIFIDELAFSDVVFEDGFESGGTSAWSSVVVD
ncbi:MAG: hypothetical protein AAGN66_24475 [Acidobacteriota bacterium]